MKEETRIWWSQNLRPLPRILPPACASLVLASWANVGGVFIGTYALQPPAFSLNSFNFKGKKTRYKIEWTLSRAHVPSQLDLQFPSNSHKSYTWFECTTFTSPKEWTQCHHGEKQDHTFKPWACTSWTYRSDMKMLKTCMPDYGLTDFFDVLVFKLEMENSLNLCSNTSTSQYSFAAQPTMCYAVLK